MKQAQGVFKIKSSCITCRARHVKCDGDRPVCLRCKESLRTCEGYETSVTKARPFKMIHYFVPSPPKIPSTFPDADCDELRSLDFFTRVTAPELGGAFAVDMWSSIIRIAYCQSATQHALAALSALHEHVRKYGYVRESDYPKYALRQYGKAMRKLVGISIEPSIENTLLALISCLVFAAFDDLRGHYASALKHVNSGVRIFVENSDVLDASGDEAVKSCKKLLTLSFLRSDSQAVEMAALATEPILRRLETHLPTIPEKFCSMDQAYLTFETFFNHFIHLELHIDDIFDQNPFTETQKCQLSESLQLENYFKAWCSAFDMADFEKCSPAARILQLHKTLVPLFKSTDCNKCETGWDTFMPEFEYLVDVGEIFLHETSNHLNFTLSLGIVHVFYFVVHRCRDPVLRRRALNILWNCKRREGIWDSAWAAQVGKRIMRIEEASVNGSVTEAAEIAETARVVVLEFSEASDRSAKVGFHRSGVGTPARDILKGGYGIPVRGSTVEKLEW